MRSFAIIIGLVACGGSPTGGDDTLEPTPDSGPASRCVSTPTAPDDPLVVVTDAGEVRGAYRGETRAFAGIPYAAAPVGARRFRATEEAACWEGVRDSFTFGSVCPQVLPSGSRLGDEDCLFLNVWTARERSTAKKPVMVFIHGGGYEVGSGNQDLVLDGSGNLYDGSTLVAERDVVVVTFNYRLGALGFLAHPALTTEDANGSSGNYGTLDQIAALRWVKTNIAAFGGDPERVLIFGESAGGLSVCNLLATPLAHGLFDAAIVESGGCKVATRETRYAQGEGVARRIGCERDTTNCMRGKSAAEFVVQASMIGEPTRLWEMMHGPNIDGYVFHDDALATIRAGTHAKVPLVVGSNADEFELFTPAFATCAGYYAYLGGIFGNRTSEVTAQYPCLAYPTPRDAAVAAMTDHMFTCEARRLARAAVAGGSPSVRRYFFTRTFTNHALRALDSFHTAELPFVFRTFDVLGYTPTADDLALSETIGTHWASLAATGDAPGWATYDPARDNALVLDMPMTTAEQIRAARCDFWDSFVAN